MESASKIHGNSSLSPSKKRKVSLTGLFNTVVDCRLGVPEEILSDLGTQFVSDRMKEVA